MLVIDGSALREFPVPNLMQAYQGHKLVLVNTAPLVFDARAGIVVRGTASRTFFSRSRCECPAGCCRQVVPLGPPQISTCRVGSRPARAGDPGFL